jgi:hypothetical protein
MPGILNETGWNLWSYQLEGLRTFESDGSRWIWREVGLGSWPAQTNRERRYTPRAVGFIVVATLSSLIPIGGLAYVFAVPLTTFLELSILALSSVSYALMAISYFLYARRLHGAAWFAPLWFLAQPVASVLTLLHIRRSRANGEGSRPGTADSPHLEEDWPRKK